MAWPLMVGAMLKLTGLRQLLGPLLSRSSQLEGYYYPINPQKNKLQKLEDALIKHILTGVTWVGWVTGGDRGDRTDRADWADRANWAKV